jgi:hypothetical protein
MFAASPSSNLNDVTSRETETLIITAVIIWEKQIEVIREQTVEGNILVYVEIIKQISEKFNEGLIGFVDAFLIAFAKRGYKSGPMFQST